jgi:cytochrome c oxidase subunit 1
VLVRDFPRSRANWINWVTTTDHKRIGSLYLFTIAFFFTIGGVEALLMRIQLGTPQNTFLDATTYNQLFTLHGTTMVFLVVIPIAAAFGSYLVPLMIGARNMAFPRLNMLSWWLLVLGGTVLYASLFFTAPEAGWTSYSPLSDSTFMPGGSIDAWILALELIALSLVLGAINFIATIHNLRAPGMSWNRLPLFCWTMLVYSYMLVIVMASFAATLAMLLIDRNFGGGFFEAAEGGSPLLWQHLFWFMGNAMIFIVALPAIGMVSEIVPVFARKPIFGYRAMTLAVCTIGALSLFAWGQHMFTAPISTGVLGFFMIVALLLVIPTAIVIFNWIATLWRGKIEFTVPMLFCIGMIAQFVVGAAAGVMLAVMPLSWQLSGTYFSVAQMHQVLVGGVVFAIVGALYFWFPKMAGRYMSKVAGKISFWLMVIGFNLTFLPLYSAGLSGMPTRISEYSASAGLHGYNLASTIGSFVLMLGLLVTIGNAVHSVRKGRKAGPDPWRANTLEWFSLSPPPPHNFDVIPIVRSAEPMKDFRRRAEQIEQEMETEQRQQTAAPVT